MADNALMRQRRMRETVQAFADQFDRPTPHDYPVAERSSLFPLATYGNGQTGLAWPGFIAEDIPNALTAPARALRGELPNYLDDRDAYIGEGLNFAGTAAVGGSIVPRPVNALASNGARISNPIRAYHGSPHDFDKFDISKIGTGEGAQAFGHGLYFAENEGVAKSYQQKLGGSKTYDVRDPEHIASRELTAAGSREAAIASLSRAIDNASKFGMPVQHFQAAKELIETGAAKPNGRMYEVNLHASPDDFLDWDKLLSQQSAKVRASIESIGTSHRPISGFRGLSNDENGLVRSEAREYAGDPSSLDRNIEMWTSAFNKRQSDGHTFDAANAAQRLSALQKAKSLGAIVDRRISDTVSDLINNLNGNTSGLREAGIPGIRYLDQGSRAAGGGTSNYVVFDPNIIEILRKYGLLGTLGAGAAASAYGAPPAEAAQTNALMRHHVDSGEHNVHLASSDSGYLSGLGAVREWVSRNQGKGLRQSEEDVINQLMRNYGGMGSRVPYPSVNDPIPGDPTRAFIYRSPENEDEWNRRNRELGDELRGRLNIVPESRVEAAKNRANKK